jgi:poly(3-hydroxybutyrate) depolymerase
MGSASSGGSSGTASSGSSGGSGSSSGSTAGGSGKIPPDLPTAKSTCPTLKTGSMQSISLNGTTMSWSMNVGSKASSPTGPIVIYWHATGTNAQESATALGDGINTIIGLGGLVAAADSTSSTGTNTGDGVWYTGDMDWADFIIACAIQQLNIDTSHIHAAGYSAGALQTGYMWYVRSGYLASAIVYSGGAGIGGGQLQDSSNAPPLIGAHGAPGSSSCTITSTNCDFLATETTAFETAAKSAGAAMVIDCNDGGDHTDIARLSNLAPVAWQFFKDHPFGQGKPDPYANGLPSGFPSYCTIQ